MRTLLVGTVALLLCTERPLEAETITAGIEIEQKVLKASPLETDVTVNIKAPREHLNWVSFRYWRHSRDEQYSTITIHMGCSGLSMSGWTLYQPKTLTIRGVLLRPSKVAEDGKSFQNEESSYTKYKYTLLKGDPIGPKEERLEGTVTRSKGGPFIFHQEGKQPRIWLCTPLHKETDPP